MKGLFIPGITAEMFRNSCLESIEELMAEWEIYDIEYEPEEKIRMTLEEAIKHAEEVAVDNKEKAEEAFLQEQYKYADTCRKCAADHRQLAEWLKLLKRILDSGDCNDCAMLHRQCRYAPGWGEQVRYNCPFYSREEE